MDPKNPEVLQVDNEEIVYAISDTKVTEQPQSLMMEDSNNLIPSTAEPPPETVEHTINFIPSAFQPIETTWEEVKMFLIQNPGCSIYLRAESNKEPSTEAVEATINTIVNSSLPRSDDGNQPCSSASSTRLHSDYSRPQPMRINTIENQTEIDTILEKVRIEKSRITSQTVAFEIFENETKEKLSVLNQTDMQREFKKLTRSLKAKKSKLVIYNKMATARIYKLKYKIQNIVQLLSEEDKEKIKREMGSLF